MKISFRAGYEEGIAKLPASLLLGFLYETVGARIAFGVGGAFAAAGCLTLVLLLRPRRRRGPARTDSCGCLRRSGGNLGPRFRYAGTEADPEVSVSEPKPCPTCGAPLPHGASAKDCPRCLLAAGLAGASGGEAGGPPPPEEIARHFPALEVEAVLGQGGMGIVYRARQKRLDRLVALKVLSPEMAREPGFAERFEREARTLARLSHPNIVGVHDFGEADGLYYLVMEYADGTNLRDVLRAGKLTPSEALAIVPQVCDALQYAHELGVVHRDIKPENIIVDRSGAVKIADFGLAKLMARSPVDVTLTRAGQVMGTVHYMAPEQYRAPDSVDHRADIFSLGVVFYEMLTGELPLGSFPPPSAKSAVDPRIDRVVLRALEQEREKRWQHASDVKTGIEAGAPAPESAAPEPAPESAPPEKQGPEPSRGRFELGFEVGAKGMKEKLVLLAVVLGVAWLIFRPGCGGESEGKAGPEARAAAMKVVGNSAMTDEAKAALVGEIEEMWKKVAALADEPNPDVRALALSPSDRERLAALSPEERKQAAALSRLGVVFAEVPAAAAGDYHLVWVALDWERDGRARVVRSNGAVTISYPVILEDGRWCPALGPVEQEARPPEDGDRYGWLHRVFGGRDPAERVTGGPASLDDIGRAGLVEYLGRCWPIWSDDVMTALGYEGGSPVLDLYRVALDPDGRTGRLVVTNGEVTAAVAIREEEELLWHADPATAEVRFGPPGPDRDGRLADLVRGPEGMTPLERAAIERTIRTLWEREGRGYLKNPPGYSIANQTASDYRLFAVALEANGRRGRAVFTSGRVSLAVTVKLEGNAWTFSKDDLEARKGGAGEADRDGWLYR